jgi:hypothetical protein
MNAAQALDEHRVSYYRIVARSASAIAGGADLRRLIDENDYVCNPCLAPLVPRLSAMPQQFNREELSAIAFFAEESDNTTRRLLDKYVARRYVEADVRAWLANGYGTDATSFPKGERAGQGALRPKQ